ncbi:MAG TPA: hypothetical protein VNP72_01480 [Longimicrobium sp.]|nr:hypothetical protein [Longimicrobium sp.]
MLVVTGRRLLVPFELRATVRGDTLAGTLHVQSMARAFTAVRQPSPAP